VHGPFHPKIKMLKNKNAIFGAANENKNEIWSTSSWKYNQLLIVLIQFE